MVMDSLPIPVYISRLDNHSGNNAYRIKMGSLVSVVQKSGEAWQGNFLSSFECNEIGKFIEQHAWETASAMANHSAL